TEIEMRHGPDEARKLHHNRVIQPELLAQQLTLLRARLNADHLVYRIADKTKQREGKQRDHNHDQEGLSRAANYESKHRVRTFEECRSFSTPPRVRAAFLEWQHYSFRNQ